MIEQPRPTRGLRLSRPKSMLAFSLCALVAAWGIRPMSSAQADGMRFTPPAIDSDAWYNPAAPTLGTLMGRELDVEIVTIDGQRRYNVRNQAGALVARGLSATELARLMPDLDLGTLDGASPLDEDPPAATLMLVDTPSGW